MPQTWTSVEEDILIENLELGYGLSIISAILGRKPESIVHKILELSSRGTLYILAASTLDAWLERRNQ